MGDDKGLPGEADYFRLDFKREEFEGSSLTLGRESFARRHNYGVIANKMVSSCRASSGLANQYVLNLFCSGSIKTQRGYPGTPPPLVPRWGKS